MHGEPATWRTAHLIRRAARREASHPTVRRHALDVTAGCSPNDRNCRARRILEYLVHRMEYVPDPYRHEAIGTPTFHLEAIDRDGRTFGDCDDGAALGAALGLSVGIPARLALASFLPSRRLHHVWTELDALGWVPIDPFRAERFGLEPSRLEYLKV